MRWPRSLTRADSSPAPKRVTTASVSKISWVPRLKEILVIPRSASDEKSAASLDEGELQVPRFARDDKNKEFAGTLASIPISLPLPPVRLAFEPGPEPAPGPRWGSMPQGAGDDGPHPHPNPPGQRIQK